MADWRDGLLLRRQLVKKIISETVSKPLVVSLLTTADFVADLC